MTPFGARCRLRGLAPIQLHHTLSLERVVHWCIRGAGGGGRGDAVTPLKVFAAEHCSTRSSTCSSQRATGALTSSSRTECGDARAATARNRPTSRRRGVTSLRSHAAAGNMCQTMEKGPYCDPQIQNTTEPHKGDHSAAACTAAMRRNGAEHGPAVQEMGVLLQDAVQASRRRPRQRPATDSRGTVRGGETWRAAAPRCQISASDLRDQA